MSKLIARVTTSDGKPELQLMEDITRATAERLLQQLSAYKGIPIVLSIFSNGGDAQASFGIADYISNPENKMDVEARVYGNAASGAMIIAQACQQRFIGPSSFALVHNAAIAEGEATAEEQKVLDVMNERQVDMYRKRTGKRTDTIVKLMEEDRLIPAEEAVDMGFFDGIIPLAKIAAFKQKQMSDAPKTRKFKVGAGDALKAIASGEIEVLETAIEAADAEKAKALTDQIDALTKERDALKAKAESAATAEAGAATAKAEADKTIAALTTERDTFKATVDKLAKNPLVAAVLAGGAEVVVPGVLAPTAPELTDREKSIVATTDAYEEFKKNRAAALKVA